MCGRHVHARLAQMRGQLATALDAGSRREISLFADLGGRPGAKAGLVGRLAQRNIFGRVCRPIDFDFIEVEEDRLAVRYLQSHEPCLQYARREDDFEWRGTGNATEMAALVVITLRPLSAVVRSQNDEACRRCAGPERSRDGCRRRSVRWAACCRGPPATTDSGPRRCGTRTCHP